MELIQATVVSNADLTKSGNFSVTWSNMPSPVQVKYTSPFVTTNNVGFMAVPNVGTKVLICKPDNDPNWYFIGSIMEPMMESIDTGKITEAGNKNPYVNPYRFRGVVPQSQIFSSPKGNKVVLSDGYSQTKAYMGTFLESSRGMKVSLDDTAGAVVISNSTENAVITITETSMGDPTMFGGPAAFSVQVTGNVILASQQGDLDIRVINGRTLNIENQTGIGSGSQNDPTVGNINIISSHGDINIEAKGNDQQIRLAATGDSGDIQMSATGTISMNAGEGVFINSGDGDINIRGQKIYLN